MLMVTLDNSAGGVHLRHSDFQFLLGGGEHRVQLLSCLARLFLFVMDH